MNRKIQVLIAAAWLPAVVAQAAENYQCTMGDLQRRVEIYNETGVPVPCEVQYFKDTEAPGERQVLWRALNEVGYCERKAEEFIAQLESYGWDCGPSGDAEASFETGPEAGSAPDAGAMEADDTDALIPAEETEPDQE